MGEGKGKGQEMKRMGIAPIAIGVTGQLEDATGDFACLVFVLWRHLRDRELSSPRVGNPLVGVSASYPVTAIGSH